MIPLDDWMILELWERQAAKVDVQIALPDTVDKEKDEAAVFKVLRVGPDVSTNKDSDYYQRVNIGDIVQISGYGNIARVRLPNGEHTIVAAARNVCFIMENEDLEKRDTSKGIIT